VSDRAFPARVFLPTSPLSPLSLPCRGGGRVVAGRRRQIPGAGRRTDRTSRVTLVGRVPALFLSAASRPSTQPRPLGQPPEAGVLAAAGRDCRRPPAAGVLAAAGRDCRRPPAAGILAAAGRDFRWPLAAGVLAAAGRDCQRPPAAVTDHPRLPTAYKRAAAHGTVSNDRCAVDGQDRASKGAAEGK